MSVAIAVENLTKTYGELRAVDGLSLRVDEGEVYALLGHNGAGKSTTVEILEGHRTPSEGTVTVLGLDPADAVREIRDRIGIVLQTSKVEPQLTVREALHFYSTSYRRPRSVDEVIDLVGLTDKADARIGTLSGGQQRRIDLGLGIIGSPEVLFLDEPTTGFDPVARRKSWQLIEDLCAIGTTVLLTTHYLDEAEHLADRVGVLVGGRLVAEGAPSELVGNAEVATVSFDLPDGIDVTSLSGVLPAGAPLRAGAITFETRQPTADLAAITSWAAQRQIELPNLSVVRPTLEDLFLRLGAESTE